MIELTVGKDSSTKKFFLKPGFNDARVDVADLGALTCVVKNKIAGSRWNITSDLYSISNEKPLERDELNKLLDGIAS